MKKIGILLAASLLVMALGGSVLAGSLDLKAGFDLAGRMSVGTDDYDVKNGFSLNGEYLVPYKGDLSLGGGVTFQLQREITGLGQFSFTPVYGLARLNLKEIPGYFTGQLGYNFFTGDDVFKSGETLTGGLYYGFGFGMNLFDKVDTQVLYSVNNGKKGADTWKYSKVRVAVSAPF